MDTIASRANTWQDLLRARAQSRPEQVLYTFLDFTGAAEATGHALTLAELDRRARAIAARIRRTEPPGARILLLYPPGIDYVAGFFGCLYAGVVAVPLYPPDRERPERTLPRIRAVVSDARASLALTTSAVLGAAGGSELYASELRSLRLLATDVLEDDEHGAYVAHEVDPDDLAILQYTSGSTTAPRGVMLTHANMLHNAVLQQRAWRLGPDSVGVSWLPLYHDLGVLTVLLQPLFSDFPTVLMAPTDFLQRPMRWLEAISRHRGTFAGGPNFAYDLCLRRSSPDERADLDLGSWRTAFNGAEPVRADTLAAFADAFAPSGFRREAFYPCYGLAETNFVSGALAPAPPIVRSFARERLERGLAEPANEGDAGGRSLVGCGQTQPGQLVRVVDPASGMTCPDSHVGEIWIAGPSVGKGYFERPEETEEVFEARLAGHDQHFLRTGDLGFFADGELFVTGRLKDLIIIRGANHHPQDIEATVAACHPALRPGCGVAFSVEEGGEERLVVVHEVAPSGGAAAALHRALFASIRRAVAEHHALEVHAIALLGPGAIFKTTSGKLQRRRCRTAFLAGELAVVAAWRRTAPGAEHTPDAQVSKAEQSTEAIEAWLVAEVARRAGIDAAEVDSAAPFSDHGLDSRHVVELSAALEAWLGRRLSATIAYEHPSITRLARHLAGAPISTTSRTSTATAQDPIAIVGIGCRFPGAVGPAAFWSLLRDGVDAITEIPADRWDAHRFYNPDTSVPGTMNTRWGGFVADVDRFDPLFFGISPREADFMDPQQRLLLEVAWEAWEDAGFVPAKLEGSPTGVFVGITTDDYGRMQWRQPDRISAHSATGTLHCVAANRLSYVFDLRGPSVAVDTACSASLVALHYACESLRRGECSLALAGGVNVILSPENAISQARLGGLSSRGRCQPFSAGADGIVRGEGAGLVVLKPLARAMADGDRIYAVIRGSAVNQDGRSNGLTAPNARAQEAVLREAYRRAGVAASTVEYVEAHGTGTPLGDPIEAHALGAMLAEGRPGGHSCALGSVKSNIGHLEAAAGIAGIIKVALALQHEAIPATLHFAAPNPRIDFDNLPLHVPTSLTAWPARSAPRIAGVSSFGIGGTNAHVVLGSAPPTTEVPARAHDRAELLPLSARSPEALRAMVQTHARWLAGAEAEHVLSDICFTAGARRSHHEYRIAVVGRSMAELRDRLGAVDGELASPAPVRRGRRGARRSIVFVFSGHGSQHPGMAQTLLTHDEVFRQAIAACDSVIGRHAGWSVQELLATEGGLSRAHTDRIQPVLFAVAVGLAAVWRSWGIEPDAVVGHSLGEVAAAHVAGILDLDDAARLVCTRSRLLMQVRGKGAMALVSLPLDEARRAIADHEHRLSVAAANGVMSTVLSGEVAALDEVLAALTRRGVFCRAIQADGAGHCPLVEPLQHELVTALADLAPRGGLIPFYSTVTADRCDGTSLRATYWGQNLREPVLLSPTVKRLVDTGHDTFIEISPHAILASAIRQDLQHVGQDALVLSSLRRGADDRTSLLESLAELYRHGHPVDFARLYPQPRRCVSLPSYPWQRGRHWLDDVPPPHVAPRVARAPGSATLFSRHIRSAQPGGPLLWELDVGLDSHPFLADHASQGTIVFPGLASVALALAATTDALGPAPITARDVEFRKPIIVPRDGGVTLQIVLLPAPGADGHANFQIHARPHTATAGDPWTLHVTGQLASTDNLEHADLGETARQEILARCPEIIAGEGFYEHMHRAGNQLGSSFQGIDRIARRAGEALGEIRRPNLPAQDVAAHRFHPAYLDACAQVLVAAGPEIRPFMPVRLERVTIHGSPGERCRSYGRVRPDATPGGLLGDLSVFDEDGRLLAEIAGAHLHHLDRPVQAPSPPARPERPGSLDRQSLRNADAAELPERLEAYLSRQVAEVMRIPPSRLDRHRGLDTLGLDSLTAAELKRRIAADVGVEITMMAFLRGTSVAELATMIAEELMHAAAQEPTLPVEAPFPLEVALDDAIRPSGPWTPAAPRRVLLTGATGFLGTFLLAELLRATDAEVHCLVRAATPALGIARLRRSFETHGLDPAEFAGRIVAVPGDLSLPRLGLTDADFSRLAAAIDLIVHDGAQVSHAAPFAQLEPVNVGGTHELLRLAVSQRPKPFHYVSTLSFFCAPERGGATVRETDHPNGAELAGMGGYAQTKWAAERLVISARERGVRASIHRPVLVGWHSRTGVHNPHDFFCTLLRGCIAMRAAPDLDLTIQMVPVDYLSRALIHLACQPTALGRDYHLSHPHPVSWQQIVELLASLGVPLRRLDYAAWQREVAATVADDPNHPLRAHASLFPPDSWAGSALETLSSRHMPSFDRSNVNEALAGPAIICPEIDEELLAAFVRALLPAHTRAYGPAKNSTSSRATAAG